MLVYVSLTKSEMMTKRNSNVEFNPFLVSDVAGKSVRLVPTGVRLSLGMPGGQTRLFISEMRESVRRRLRSERRLPPTRHYSRM
jgi:hypothetical protein